MQEKKNTLFKIHPCDGAKKPCIHIYMICTGKSQQKGKVTEKSVILICYKGNSRYAGNINYAKYLIAIKSYFKGLSVHEEKTLQPRFEH